MTIEPEVLAPLPRWRRVVAFLWAIEFREKCFHAGLVLAWIGLAGWSWRLATAAVGATLVGVAVFGIAPAKGSGRAT